MIKLYADKVDDRHEIDHLKTKRKQCGNGPYSTDLLSALLRNSFYLELNYLGNSTCLDISS